MSSELTSKEVADRIGVSMSTLKNWAVRLPVPSVLGPDGTRRFPEEALAVLEAVKQLRDEERSYATIRRAILPVEDLADDVAPDVVEEAAPAPLPEPPALEVTVTLAPPEPEAPAEPSANEAAMALVTQVLQLVREESAMAEAYATARQRVGELEAQVKLLQEDRQRMQAELADARRLIGQREVQWARRPWYQRLKTYLFP
jgi:DNA-binding transcriptional MerR regulator